MMFKSINEERTTKSEKYLHYCCTLHKLIVFVTMIHVAVVLFVLGLLLFALFGIFTLACAAFNLNEFPGCKYICNNTICHMLKITRFITSKIAVSALFISYLYIFGLFFNLSGALGFVVQRFILMTIPLGINITFRDAFSEEDCCSRTYNFDTFHSKLSGVMIFIYGLLIRCLIYICIEVYCSITGSTFDMGETTIQLILNISLISFEFLFSLIYCINCQCFKVFDFGSYKIYDNSVLVKMFSSKQICLLSLHVLVYVLVGKFTSVGVASRCVYAIAALISAVTSWLENVKSIDTEGVGFNYNDNLSVWINVREKLRGKFVGIGHLLIALLVFILALFIQTYALIKYDVDFEYFFVIFFGFTFYVSFYSVFFGRRLQNPEKIPVEFRSKDAVELSTNENETFIHVPDQLL